jgi:2-dehydropantoate 2-reductase
MRILVYGAGVLGSYLAHMLLRGRNDVTLLARGEWKRIIDKDGLVIRHYIQRKTTVDKIKTVDSLASDDVYDIVFVVMQYVQLSEVLPSLAANKSGLVVFVGNNADAARTKAAISTGIAASKNVLFGFQASAGHRENGRVISLHLGGSMTLGGINGEDTGVEVVMSAFKNIKYMLSIQRDMYVWLVYHLALIMPICYACYACGGNLKRVDKSMTFQIIDAINEGFSVLAALDISHESEDAWLGKRSAKTYYLLKLVCKTPLGKLMASDHAMSAVSEMMSLNGAFDELTSQADIKTPSWDLLEQNMPYAKTTETQIQ